MTEVAEVKRGPGRPPKALAMNEMRAGNPSASDVSTSDLSRAAKDLGIGIEALKTLIRNGIPAEQVQFLNSPQFLAKVTSGLHAVNDSCDLTILGPWGVWIKIQRRGYLIFGTNIRHVGFGCVDHWGI